MASLIPPSTVTVSISASASRRYAALQRLSARMLPLNSLRTATVALKTLRVVLSNLIAHPQQCDKYGRLRLTNPRVRDRVVACAGAVEFLQSVGFVPATEGREQFLLLRQDDLDIARVQAGVATLDAHRDHLTASSAAAANGGRGSSSNSSDDVVLAECALQVALPSGRTLRGAFSLQETLAAVYAFVDACRLDGQSGEPCMLCTAYPPRDLPLASSGEQTVEALGLAPRSKLLVKKTKRADAPGVFEDNPADRLARDEAERAALQERLDREAAIKAAKRAEFEARRKERERALTSFQDDRSDVTRRVAGEERVRSGNILHVGGRGDEGGSSGDGAAAKAADTKLFSADAAASSETIL